MSDDTTPVQKRAPRKRKPTIPTSAAGAGGNGAAKLPASAPATSVTASLVPARSSRKPRKTPKQTDLPARESPLAVQPVAAAAGSPVPSGDLHPLTLPETPTPVQRMLMRVPLAVRWRDLDAFNHVNNSKYLSYLEEARLQWMLTLPGQGLDERVAPVVAAAHLNYRRPIEWPADVMVELFVERLGRTSLTVGHRISAAHPDAAPILFCDGHVVMVWIDRSSGSAAALPEAVVASCR